MAFTTWNANDKDAITLTGSNLIAAGSSTGDHGVRATDIKYAGKWYFEITAGATFAGGDSGFGVASPGLNFTSITDRRPLVAGSAGAGGGFLFRSGSVFVNGSSAGSVVGIGTTNTFGVTVNLDSSPPVIGFKRLNGGGGNWNNNGANDPDVGAFDISTVARLGVFPCFLSGGLGDIVTANFGASGFVGAVPTGYTSGWTTTSAVLYIDPVSICGGESVGSATKAVTMTTQAAGDVYIVVGTEASASANVLTGVSGASLGAFTRRKTHHTKPGTVDMVVEIWYKHSAAPLSGEVITATLSSSNDRMSVIGFQTIGASSGIWDADASLPATNQNSGSTSRTVGSVSTSAAPSIVLGLGMSPNSPDTYGSGFASGYSGLQGFYGHSGGTNWCDLVLFGKYVAATQSGITVATATISSEQWAIVADAIDELPAELDIVATTHTVGVNMAAILDTPIATVLASVGVQMAAALTTRKNSGIIVIVCT